MHLRALIKHILSLVLIIGIGYFCINYSGPVKDKFLTLLHLSSGSVKGASTERAKEITNHINADIGSQAASVKNQLLNIKVSDLLNMLARVQKIPKDINSIQSYIKDQVDNFSKSKHASASAR